MTELEQYGPCAVITGAGDGIGRTIAKHAAAESLDVVLARSHGVQARVGVVDISQTSCPATLLEVI